MRPVLVLSDVHLWWKAPRALRDDLDACIAAHPGHELILAGDTFDLSILQAGTQPRELLAEILEQSPTFLVALRAHLATGGTITFIPGNHDSSLLEAKVQAVLLRALAGEYGLLVDDPEWNKPEWNKPEGIKIVPWFTTRFGVHIEHGHLYDPDNAPPHPLVQWGVETEPIGIALMRRFVAKSGAFHFAHAHDTRPLSGFVRAWTLYKYRAPLIIAQYFHAAIAMCLPSSKQRSVAFSRERSSGTSGLDGFARAVGLERSQIVELLANVPSPRHERRRDVFLRLYFDRVIATVLAALGVLNFAAVGTGLGLTALGGGYVAWSLALAKDRYPDVARTALRQGARSIRRITGARSVVFGHTHIVDSEPGYLNMGSFAFGAGSLGRPYARITEDGTVTLGRINVSP